MLEMSSRMGPFKEKQGLGDEEWWRLKTGNENLINIYTKY